MNDALESLLADPEQAGVVMVEPVAIEAIAQAAQALDFVMRRVDLRPCVDAEAALQALARALELPEWFGGNWDSLADSINDLSWLPGERYLLLLEHADGWRNRDAVGFDTLLEILRNATEFWAEIGVPFWTVIATDAQLPDPALP